MGRLLPGRRAWDEWDEPWEDDSDDAAAAETPKRSRRLAGTVTFAALFFAGAALSAGAGDQMRGLLGDDGGQTAVVEPASASDTSTDATTTTSQETTTDEAQTEQPPADASQSADSSASDDAATADEDAQSGPDETAPRNTSPSSASVDDDASAPSLEAGSSLKAAATAKVHPHWTARPHRARVHRQKAQRRVVARPQAPEVEGPGAATIWLNRALPDPTPPEARLSAAFAQELAATSKHNHLDWAFVLGVLRARGGVGSSPAGAQALRSLESRLTALGARANPWGSALAYFGQTSAADRAVALGHFYRAVGLDAVVQGLEAQRFALARRVLADRRVSIYAGGQGDLASGRVNVRVTALIEYLAETFGQVTVSCLITGHRLYARPGVISAHIYGHAVDISSVGGTAILGHQQPGSVTEQAVRAILLLPPGMLPRQVISLLGLGGPSFPLADHYNHIHVGY